MAEFLVGLVCIMLLVVGLQQISFLSQKGFLAMHNARHQMAIQYAEDPPSEWYIFNFSSPARPGPDGRSFTADDELSGGDDSFYQDLDGFNGIDGYVYTVRNDLLEIFYANIPPTNPQLDLKYSGGMFSTTPALHMMYTQDHQAVDAVPFMDKVLGRDQILIGRSLWMPRWDAIP